jgi:N-dimethylarginine dimethylaminohydrolase
MYSVHQHWDPLKVCAVGRSYPPQFYDYIKNKKVRDVFYKIAEETEEDLQKLVNKLESFGVQTVRPDVVENYKDVSFIHDGTIKRPPMYPRDITAMIGETFYMTAPGNKDSIEKIIKSNRFLTKSGQVPHWGKEALHGKFNPLSYYQELQPLLKLVEPQGNTISFANYQDIFKDRVSKEPMNTAMISRIGKDLYFGTEVFDHPVDFTQYKNAVSEFFSEYRCHVVDTQGHYDSVFCPVIPGFIVSLKEVKNYEETFPGWEVLYLPNQSFDAIPEFMALKKKNYGKWWVPGQELNDDFTEYVEKWMKNWVGYVEETVFDVNMLVIDKKNVLCNGYNQQVFDAFSRHGITPHIVNMRHRYFWDGGIHCLTSDLHREGTQNDYFPERD